MTEGAAAAAAAAAAVCAMKSDSPLSDLLLSVHLNGCRQHSDIPLSPPPKHRQHDSDAWLNTAFTLPHRHQDATRYTAHISFFISIFNVASKETALIHKDGQLYCKCLPKMHKSRLFARWNIIFRSHFVYCGLFKCWKRHREGENTEWMLPKIVSPCLCCVWWPPAGSRRDSTALFCTDCWPDLTALGGLPCAKQVHA